MMKFFKVVSGGETASRVLRIPAEDASKQQLEPDHELIEIDAAEYGSLIEAAQQASEEEE